MPKTTRVVVLLAILCTSILAFATAQMGDKLVLDGKDYFIYTNPLETYLEKHPGLLPKSTVMSTANWRGYVASWTVKDNRLVLTDVQIQQAKKTDKKDVFETEWVSVMARMFPDQKEVVADWFRGNIIVPNGKQVHYVHMGYASTYEKYIILRVENGAVTRNQSVDYKEFVKFRDTQFGFFKKTDEFKKAMAEASKEGGMTEAQNEEFIREYYSAQYMSAIYD